MVSFDMSDRKSTRLHHLSLPLSPMSLPVHESFGTLVRDWVVFLLCSCALLIFDRGRFGSVCCTVLKESRRRLTWLFRSDATIYRMIGVLASSNYEFLYVI